MRTRLSPRNQKRLWRELCGPESYGIRQQAKRSSGPLPSRKPRAKGDAVTKCRVCGATVKVADMDLQFRCGACSEG